MFVVMTGGTQGIGLAAARGILAAPDVQFVTGVRASSQVPRDISSRARLLALDLASLQSVRDFCDQILAGPKIDRLVLNAGIQIASPQKSSDGFEITFAVNHLAHFLMVQRLTDHMAQDGRIILTASGTHDPDAKTGMPAPRHANANMLAFPERDSGLDPSPGTAGRRAYSTSKLLNVMTVRQLAKNLTSTRPDLMTASFDPGFTPGTGLARNYPGPARFIFQRVLPLVIRGDRMSTPERSGALLARLVMDPEYATARGDYFSYHQKGLRNIPPSKLALDDAACQALWADSEALLLGK